MKNIKYLFIVTLIIFSCTNENVFEPEDSVCDNGTFVGEVNLGSQEEVDTFGANCYSKIDGKLYISASGSESSDIFDLSPLSSLTEIFSTTEITPKIYIVNNDSLKTLNGLQNIKKASGIVVSKNDQLIDLAGLEGLEELRGSGYFNDLVINKNKALENLNGLQNLTIVGLPTNSDATIFISIQGNDKLSNLNALSNLNTVYGKVYIGLNEGQGVYYEGNPSLIDYCGLRNLFSNGFFESAMIANNAFNPTVQDIIDGNCSQ